MSSPARIDARSPARRHLRGAIHVVRAALSDWAASHGTVAIFLLKTVLAALLAAGLAMAFDLSQPRTALATVFVLMQPLNGLVLAKSVYRIIGTLTGAVAAVVFASCFAQMPEGYLVALSLWIAVCTGAAARHRGFRWYGFVLAGYTAALVGVPHVMHPETVFDASLTRTAEVVLGVICSGLVSALVFPKHASAGLRDALRERHAAWLRLIADVVAQRIAPHAFESAQWRMVEQAVDFETARLPAAFEEPEMRARQGRLARLNIERMRAATRLHALFRLIDRVQDARGTDAVRGAAALAVFRSFLADFARVLDACALVAGTHRGATISNDATAQQCVAALAEFRDALPLRIRRARMAWRAKIGGAGHMGDASDDNLLDFDTAAELLYRLADELTDYASTYAALTPRRHPRERHSLRYVFHTHWRVALTTGLRSGAVVLAIGAFWIATDWPSGGFALIAASFATTLFSTAPNPSRWAWQFCGGAVMASLASYLFVTRIYPSIDGFVLLACAVSVPFAIAAWLASFPRTAGYGFGLGVFFCTLAGPDNVIVYQPDGLINDSLAAIGAVALAALAYRVVFPSGGRWMVKRMQADLRAQIAIACEGWLGGWHGGLEARFHSATRDLTAQLGRTLAHDPGERDTAMAWSLSTLELGHSIIGLREGLDALCRQESRIAPSLDSAIKVLLSQIAALFAHPDIERATAASIYADATIATLQSALDGALHGRSTRHLARRVLSELHFIRTALLDANAPWRVRAPVSLERQHHV